MSENCYLCQEPKSVVGHDTQTCPNVLCKKCGQKGHVVRNCQVSVERPKDPESATTKQKDINENDIEQENEDLVFQPLAPLPETLKSCGHLGSSVEFMMDLKSVRIPEKCFVLICATNQKSNDFVIVERMASLRNKIVVVKFKALRDELRFVDPSLLKQMFVCKPTVSLLEKMKEMLHRELRSNFSDTNQSWRKVEFTSSKSIEICENDRATVDVEIHEKGLDYIEEVKVTDPDRDFRSSWASFEKNSPSPFQDSLAKVSKNISDDSIKNEVVKLAQNDVVIRPHKEKRVLVKIMHKPVTCAIKRLESSIQGLRILDSFPKRIKSSNKLELRLLNTTNLKVHVRRGDVLGTITKAIFGTCVFLTLDRSKNVLNVKSSLFTSKGGNMSASDSKDTKLIFDFDPTKPAPKHSDKGNNLPYSYRSLALNKYALLFLQELKWPQEILFIFQSECEARLCMRTIFPDPDLVSKVLKVRVHIMPLRDIDWSFQSSQSGFENFPSKPLNKILGPELGIECIEEGSIRIHPNEKAEVRVQVYGEEITCIKKTRLIVRGLERTDSRPIQIDERVIQFGFCLSLQNTSWDTIHIWPGDILGNVSEAIRAFGASAFLTLDLERKRLRVESKYQVSYIENFDSSKGLPEMWKNKMHILNKHSVSLLQLLKNPKSMLLIFKTEREASLCLKSLLPNPALIETKKMRICIQVMPFNEISMNFQSTLDESRSFPAKSLKHFVKTSKKDSGNTTPKGRKRKVEIVELDQKNEERKSKWRKV